MNIIELICDFKKNNSMLWVEANNIRLFLADGFVNSDGVIDAIKKFKPEILDFLVSNKIFSKEDFQKRTIFKSNRREAVLSFAQKRLWFIELYEEGSNAYHVPLEYELDAHMDIAGIKYAIQKIVARHEVLRSTIEHGDHDEYGIQRVHEEPLLIEEITLTDQDDLQSLMEDDINQPFDLSTAYPIRAKFYTIQSTETLPEEPLSKTLLLINFHHIATDGWSIDIFEKEWDAYYEAYIHNDTQFSLPELEIQYKDYAVWQRAYLTGTVLENQLNYWKEKLSGFQTLELPNDYSRPGEIDYSGSIQEFTLSGETSQKLIALAQHYGVTLNSVMLSSVNIFLGKYTGQDDIITGSVIANRHHRQTEALIGFFVNTQVNRSVLNNAQNYTDLIKQVHQDQIEAQLHQDLPFEMLVDELGIERDTSRHPLFQVMFDVEGFGNKDYDTEEEKNVHSPFHTEDVYKVEKFDLSIHFNDNQPELMGRVSFATALFSNETIERLIHHYTILVDQLAESPELPYSQFSLLSAEEYHRIVYEWNDSGKDEEPEGTVYQVFQEQAEKNPHAIALVYGGKQLSYKELNEKSNQLARLIREQYQQRTKQPLAPDTLIALYLDRGLEMVIGILAVVKAGGAYVPMDPAYPQERIDYLLTDTKTELIISQRHLNKGISVQLPPGKVIFADLDEVVYHDEDPSNLPAYSKPTDLAYVIYTSGTTGKPKGVMVEQHHVLKFAIKNNYINNDQVVVVAGLANYAFDGSIFDIFFPLLNGRKLIVIDNRYLLDLSVLENELNEYKVDTIFFTTSLFNSLVQNQSKCLYNLKQVIFGGEAANREIINRFKTRYNQTTLIHAYGPTENVVYSTFCNLNNCDTSAVVPIGKKLSGKYVYVLDRNFIPVPAGVTGELYIGGTGLSRGYLNLPELTNERFITNPFATEADRAKGFTRFYKTGDLVRWLPDGNIEFVDRNDDQIKIRGYRIELGEIEFGLTGITGIKQSCVLAKERKTASGSDKYLVAYFVPDNAAGTLTPLIIREKLLEGLPEYMVPDLIIAMDAFPITVNGKLDKRALPDPDFSASEEYIAPTTETETAMCSIWQEVLGLDHVGITDNFFRIGGNSILAIQVSHRMSKTLGCDVKVADVFIFKNIQILLENISVKQVNPDNVEWDVLINSL